MARKSKQRTKPIAKQTAPLTVTPEAALTSLNGDHPEIKYSAKATIFAQGDPADAVYYVASGKVQISVVSKQGKTAVITMLGTGDFFGESSLTGQAAYLSSATTTTAATIIKIAKPRMVRALHERPAFAERFMEHLLARGVRTDADLVDQLFNSTEKRLARVLLLLANLGKESTLETVVPKVNQELLAARIGTTRPRVNYFMNKFRKLGLIDYDGGDLKVHSSLLNVIVHDD